MHAYHNCLSQSGCNETESGRFDAPNPRILLRYIRVTDYKNSAADTPKRAAMTLAWRALKSRRPDSNSDTTP